MKPRVVWPIKEKDYLVEERAMGSTAPIEAKSIGIGGSESIDNP